MKLGQTIKFKDGFEVKSPISNKIFNIKEGDEAIVTKNGYKMLSGEARYKKINFRENDVVDGINYSKIASLIYKRLNNEYEIEEFLNDCDIEPCRVIDSIMDILEDII